MAPAHYETEIVKKLANKYAAVTEYRLWDNTRVDLLSDEYAWEVDWSHKWAEAVGQTLYYAEVTGRKPGVVLLVRNKHVEGRHVYRCQAVCAKHGIRLSVEEVSSLI